MPRGPRRARLPLAGRPRPGGAGRGSAARDLALAGFLLVGITAAAWPEIATHLLGSPTPTLAGVATVIDGDTIEIHGQRIRLHGIDAPESGQSCQDAEGRGWRCGQRAALELQTLIGRRTVACDQRDVDQYGRIVARCRVGEVDVNEALVQAGLALAYRRYSRDYVSARAAGRGMWSGEFVPPWDWRRSR